MSIQKPVAWCREPDKYGRRKLSFEKPSGITASTWHPLYALPGAQRAPGAPDAHLRSRVADLLHLMQFAQISCPSEGDDDQVRLAMKDIGAMLAAAMKPEGE